MRRAEICAFLPKELETLNLEPGHLFFSWLGLAPWVKHATNSYCILHRFGNCKLGVFATSVVMFYVGTDCEIFEILAVIKKTW